MKRMFKMKPFWRQSALSADLVQTAVPHMLSLISIRFRSCDVRRLKRALESDQHCNTDTLTQTQNFTWAKPNSANEAHVRFGVWPNQVRLIVFGAAEVFFAPGRSWLTPEDRLWVKRRSSYESNKTQNLKKAPFLLFLEKSLTSKTLIVICLL